MFASIAHSGSVVKSFAGVTSCFSTVQATIIRVALRANKILFIRRELVLVELAAIAGLIDFAVCRNSDVPIFEVAVFITVVKEEGPTALWKGLTPTMIRQGSNQSCNFMTFYALNKYVWGKEIGSGQKIESWKSFVNGVIAGSVGPILNNPFDVAKTRLMAQGNEKEYRNTIDCITKVFHQEGPTSLWKGIIPRLTRTALGQGIAWMTVMKFVEYYDLGSL